VGLKGVSMLKLLLTCVLFNSSVAWALDYSQFLDENKQFTNSLVSFLDFEEYAELELLQMDKELSLEKKHLNSVVSNVESTQKQIAQAELRLIDLKNKAANKETFLENYKSQKNENINRINSLNNQISSKQSSINQVNDKIALVEIEKNSLEYDLSAQQQISNKALLNIDRINRDINLNQSEMNRNRYAIESLKMRNDNLKIKISMTDNPNEKNMLMNEIERNRREMDQLRNQNQYLESQNNQLKSQIYTEQNDYNFAQNQINNIKIRLNSKYNELNSYTQTKNKFQVELKNLSYEKTSLEKKNALIDQNIFELNNLPELMANTQIEITKSKESLQSLEVDLSSQKEIVQKLETHYASNKNILALNKQKVLDEEVQQRELVSEVKNMQIEDSVVDDTLSDSVLKTLSDVVIIKESKDWSVFKGYSLLLNQNFCAAGTEVVDKISGAQSELLVIKTISTTGKHSSPFIIVSGSKISGKIKSGTIKTDKTKVLDIAVLQGLESSEKNLISFYTDNSFLIKSLKSYNSAKVEFILANKSQSQSFSLRGSSAMISEFEKVCNN
jgi:chromosome segregation ATPase